MEEEKKIEPTSKKNNKLIITIIIIFLFIIGLGIIAFSKITNFITKKIEEGPVQWEEIETSEPEETKEIEPVEETTSNSEPSPEERLQTYVDYISPSTLDLSSTEKIFNVSRIVASEMSAKDKIEYIGEHITKETKGALKNGYGYSVISENDVARIVENIYGPNTYERTSFNLGYGSCGSFSFDENDGNYYAPAGCGGMSATRTGNVIIDYKENERELEITTAYAFLTPKDISSQETYQLFKDYNHQELLGEYNRSEVVKGFLENYIKEHKNELYHIIYTFESPDGTNYYFTGFTNTRG